MEFEKHWIGRGTFSDVFELVGHHPPAVLKLIHCATDAQRDVYEKEYATLKELEHPNIVEYIRREQIDEYRFGIVMEYCQLGNLKKLVFNPTLIYTMHTVAFWGEQLFGALDYMYRKHKVIHRDIKPENIFAAEDWTLKIGDFGSIKMIEQTCTGTFAGTQRYRSPPQLDENNESWGQMDTSLQDSHRNDVYSLGLILWEIIQRRTVFTEYDVKSGGFNRELFLVDIVLKRLKGLKRPECQIEMGNIIAKCTDFNLSSRQSAREIESKLKAFREENTLIASLEFTPLNDSNQKALLRPIGFNGKRERVLVDSSFSNFEPYISFGEISKKNIVFQRKLEFTNEFDDCLRDVFKEIDQSSDNIDLLMEEPFIIHEAKMQHGYEYQEKNVLKRELKEKLANRKGLSDSVMFPLLFELWILNDIYCQMQCFSWFFDFLNPQGPKGHYLSPWSNYQLIANYIRWLEELKTNRFTIPINFKHFFQKSCYQEWFQISKNENLFVKKTLQKVKMFPGKWSKQEKKENLIFEQESCCSESKRAREQSSEELLDSDAMTFLNLEPVYLFEFLQAAREKMRSFSTVAKFTKIESTKKLTMEIPKIFDLPIPNYVFQLTNPPRCTCKCATKCAIQLIEPLRFVYQLSNLQFESLTEEMKIISFKCSSREELDYLELYYAILDIFHSSALGLTADSVYPKIRTKNFDDYFQSKANFFLFLNYQSGNYIEMIFLDHPDNYENPERIPCLDFTLSYRSLEFSKAKQFFDETPLNKRTFTLINHQLKAQILSYNGKPLSDWFELENESSWPEQLREPKVVTEKYDQKVWQVESLGLIETFRKKFWSWCFGFQ